MLKSLYALDIPWRETHKFLARKLSQINNTLLYKKYGKPLEVLEMECDNKVCCPADDEVMIKMIGAPVNPIDVCTIRGEYPFKGCVPSVGGHEGYGVVIHVGRKLKKKICPGDRVIFNTMEVPTWRSYVFTKLENLFKISCKIQFPEAATFLISPSTAYRILKDYGSLQSGDVIIQNCADGAVGQAIHQLGYLWKYKTIGIIQNGSDVAETKKYLKSLGASEVLTQEEFYETKIFDKKYKEPKMAIDCVGGEVGAAMACRLGCKGSYLAYSSVNCDDIPVNPKDLIYRKISYCGFWFHRWLRENKKSKELQNMLKNLHTYYEKGKLKAPRHCIMKFEDYEKAADSFNLKSRKKTIFEIGEECN